MKTIVAIDPGLSGGLAVSGPATGVYCYPMPATGGDLLELMRDIKTGAYVEGDELVCVLEEVSGFAGKAQPGSAMFRFGEHFGFIKGVIQALEIRLVLVRPQVWQKGFGLGTASGCATKTVWKNKLKAEAQRRFPHVDVTLKTADALLILDYAMGRRCNRETEGESASDLTAEGARANRTDGQSQMGDGKAGGPAHCTQRRD